MYSGDMPPPPHPSQDAKFAFYRILHKYTPEPEEADGMLAIEVGDLIEVKRPVAPEEGTEEHPEGH